MAQLLKLAVGQPLARAPVNIADYGRARTVGREHGRERGEQVAEPTQRRCQRVAILVESSRRNVVEVVWPLGPRVALAQLHVVIAVFVWIEDSDAPEDAADELVHGLVCGAIRTGRSPIEELGGLLGTGDNDYAWRYRRLVVIARARRARVVGVEQLEPVLCGHRLPAHVV